MLKFLNTCRLKKNKKQLEKFKNVHKGQRCFIVGNGPSLITADLEKLKGEFCFASHRIYNIFEMTDWRPTYYCAQDFKLIKTSYKEIEKMEIKDKFVAIIKVGRYPKLKDCQLVHIITEQFYPGMPQFSNDIANGIYEGFTVSYMCIQLAVYMGFKEIYLLGIDHNYSKTTLPSGEVVNNQGVKDHFSENDKIENIPQLYKSILAYEKAKTCESQYGYKIFNATRGGKLEIFERVDFDSLF